MFGLIGSAIGAVGNLISGNKTNKTNLRIARETNEAQMKLAQYQADQNLNLWNLNNEYNTPAAQMERYKEAGLNPHLMYGQGSSGNSSSPSEGFQAPRLNVPHVENYSGPAIQNSVQTAMNGLQMAANIKKASAETSQIYQNIENLKSDNDLKAAMLIKTKLDNAKSTEEAKLWSRLLMARINNLDSGSTLNSANADLANSNRMTNDVLRPLLVQEKTAQIKDILETTLSRKSERSLTPFRKKLLSAQIAGAIQGVQESRSRTRLIDVQSAVEQTRNKGYSLDNTIKSILVNSGLNITNDELDRLEYQLNTLGMDNTNSFRVAKYGARLAGAALGK